jgi:hypothetical protein
MHTLFDYVTHIKTIEYLLAVSFIAGFIIFWEIFKPKPFSGLSKQIKDDMEHLRETGMLQSIGKLVAAPFIGLVYIIAIPIIFYFTIVSTIVIGFLKLVGVNAAFNWNPVEAYLGGKKGKEGKK